MKFQDAGGQISRQSTSYRQGVVLGLTMAEVMLLLVFCLLLAVAAVLSKEKSDLIRVQEDLVKAHEQLDEAKLARTSTEHVMAALRENPQLREALEGKAGTWDSAQISEFWRKLVDSEAAMNELERNGMSRSDVLQSANFLKEAKDIRKLGVRSAAEVGHNADLVAKIKEAFKGHGEPTDEHVIAALRDGLVPSSFGSGHQWPPIIKLSEANGYFFDSGKARLKPEFESKIRGPVVDALLKTAEEYKVDVIEVVGHTDEQPIGLRSSNLDRELSAVLANPAAVDRLVPADNAGLGLARAVSVAAVLKADARLSAYKILPLSGAQLIRTDETLSAGGFSSEDVKERRRIEIRLRKSSTVTEPSAAIPVIRSAPEHPLSVVRSRSPSVASRLPFIGTERSVPPKPNPPVGSQAPRWTARAVQEPEVPSTPASVVDHVSGYDPAGH